MRSSVGDFDGSFTEENKGNEEKASLRRESRFFASLLFGRLPDDGFYAHSREKFQHDFVGWLIAEDACVS